MNSILGVDYTMRATVIEACQVGVINITYNVNRNKQNGRLKANFCVANI